MKDGWRLTTVGDVCEIINGGTPKTDVPDYWGGRHRWITPAEMGKRPNPYVGESARKLTDLGLANSSARLLPPHSVILSSRAPIGHLVINTEPMATNQGCKGLVPNKLLDHKFLFFYLTSIVDHLNELGTGTTFKELSGAKLKEVRLPVPPLPEQKRIVAILDEAFEGIDRAIANTEKNLANAREVFESYREDIFENPGDGWVHTTLGEVCKFHGGSQPPKSVFSTDNGPDRIRLIQIRDYKSDRHVVYIPKAQARRVCDESDVMIGRYGPPLFQILRGLNGAYNVALMKATPNEKVLSKDYLFQFLKNRQILRYIIHSSNRAAGQIGLNKETIEPYPIAVPTKSEQKAIVTKLEALAAQQMMLARVYEMKLNAMAELKQAILRKAFAGELTARSVDNLHEAAA